MYCTMSIMAVCNVLSYCIAYLYVHVAGLAIQMSISSTCFKGARAKPTTYTGQYEITILHFI